LCDCRLAPLAGGRHHRAARGYVKVSIMARFLVRTVRLALVGVCATVAIGVGGPTASAETSLVVCLDPGHSLLAGGAVVEVTEGRGRNAQTTTLTEAEINLDVALAVASELEARFAGEPVSVLLTWGRDDGNTGRAWSATEGPASDDRTAVEARGAFCEANGATVVVSLHTNGANLPFNGTLTGYRDADDLELAAPAHDSIYAALANEPGGKRIGGFRDFGLDQGDWWISLGAPNSVVAIFEPVLMTNDKEAARLLPSITEAPAGRRAQIAAAEAAAIATYVEGLLGG
jgi:N-acetylmuramoyl-L-alanine amidase